MASSSATAEHDRKPAKGILKQSSSFDAEGGHIDRQKRETKWDEMNILATYHPANKDYGHQKIDEPPTPYSHIVDEEMEDEEIAQERSVTLDPTVLAISLEKGSKPKVMTESVSSDEDEENLTEQQKAKKLAFEEKRRLHYNEFYAAKLGRKLIESAGDSDDENEREDIAGNSASINAT